MGNIIRRDGRLYHETGPGQEEQIALDELGQPLVGILFGETIDAAQDGANVVLAIGNSLVSFPAAVASDIIAALAQFAPDAKAEEARQVLAGLQQKLDRDRDERRAAVETLIADRLEAVAVLDTEIAARQDEIAAKTAELRKLGEQREDTDIPVRA